MTPMIRMFGLLAVVLSFSFIPANAMAGDDAEEITNMVNEFLAASYRKQAHVDFWADELVYTSSNGTRFGKADILAGFENAGGDEAAEPDVRFSGEDIKVQLYGNTAVVTFKLVGTPVDGSDLKYYFNTGTFIKREGQWRAVAWQATVIPE